jgi:transposase
VGLDTHSLLGPSRGRRCYDISIQLAWNWIRWQPASALSRWYRAHFGDRKRARRIGIVAVARKLVIALWRYVTAGIVPTGAVWKGVAGA